MTEFDIRELLDGFMDDGIEIREKEVVSLANVKEDVMNRIDKPAGRKSRKIARVILAAAVCAAVLTATALAAELLRLDERRGEIFHEAVYPDTVAPAAEETRSADMEYTTVNIIGAVGSPEYKAAQEWSDWRAAAEAEGRNELFPEGFENMTPEELEEKALKLNEDIYASMDAYSDEAHSALDTIVEKYGLRLPEYRKDVTWQELQDMAGDPDVLPIDAVRSMDYCEGGTMEIIVSATLESGKTVNYDLHRSVKGVFSRALQLVAETNIMEEWQYTTADGTTVTLNLGANKSAIMADMENGFVYVNVRSATENTDTTRDGLGVDTLTREDLEELADAIHFTALDGIK